MSALDELRFGADGILNLREGLPSSADAVRRAEAWLRERQVRGGREVLVITGRGSHSDGGVAVIREAVQKLLFSLRRRGVVSGHAEHNPGAFVVQLAPLRALADAPPRRREQVREKHRAPALHGLSPKTHDLLRQLAERSLDALAVVPDERRIDDEMHRHLRVIAPGLRGGRTWRMSCVPPCAPRSPSTIELAEQSQQERQYEPDGYADRADPHRRQRIRCWPSTSLRRRRWLVAP